MRILVIITLISVFFGCESRQTADQPLPFLGRMEISNSDTLYHRISDFRFVDQDSNWVSNESFDDKIYIADFFFTTCPDICPKMKAQMLRVYDEMEQEPEVLFLSHTIDPKHDSVAVLKEFANRINVKTEKWHFVTGEKEDIYKLGQTSYMASMADEGALGLTHSGKFFLIDKERHIRGAYDGTNPEEVDILIKDIRRLLNSYSK